MNVISIIGASGYVGRHLVTELVKTQNHHVKVLSRILPGKGCAIMWPTDVEVIQGDLQDPHSLQGLFEPDCTVINLAYLWHAGESGNLKAINNLLNACKEAQVKRLIHCSTAIVVGSVSGGWVTEDTECKPTSEYEITKLKIEHVVRDDRWNSFDRVILRPTSVFGPAALPLEKFASDLVGGNRLLNYLKSCFLGNRRMNLVYIDNVISAVLFMLNYPYSLNGEIFIVSDDFSQANRFGEIEHILTQRLQCRGHFFPPIPLPYFLLTLILKLFGKPKIKPSCNYSQSKLQNLGFKSPLSFEQGLLHYAEWYRLEHQMGQQRKPN